MPIDNSQYFCNHRVVAKNEALRKKMIRMKVNRIPVIIKTHNERVEAYNIARSIGIMISTNRIVNGVGFYIWRIE